MFRTNNGASSGGVLYKQHTVFHHVEIILKLYELFSYRVSSYIVIKMIKITHITIQKPLYF